MFSRFALATSITALTIALTAGAAHAAPVDGSHVDSTLFNSAIGSTAGWDYLGQSTTDFSGSGTLAIAWRDGNYANSFGYSRTNHDDRVEVFSASDPVGTTELVSGYMPGYLFYFASNGSDFLIFSDDNKQYTDGHDTGGNPGEEQGDIDIFHHVASNTWAFFFDDAGGGAFIAGDDNDYNDMVVTFMQQAEVPEPGSLALLGASLLGLAAMRRRKTV